MGQTAQHPNAAGEEEEDEEEELNEAGGIFSLFGLRGGRKLHQPAPDGGSAGGCLPQGFANQEDLATRILSAVGRSPQLWAPALRGESVDGWDKPSPNGGNLNFRSSAARGAGLQIEQQEEGRKRVQQQEGGHEGMHRECRHCHSLFCSEATEGGENPNTPKTHRM